VKSTAPKKLLLVFVTDKPVWRKSKIKVAEDRQKMKPRGRQKQLKGQGKALIAARLEDKAF